LISLKTHDDLALNLSISISIRLYLTMTIQLTSQALRKGIGAYPQRQSSKAGTQRMQPLD